MGAQTSILDADLRLTGPDLRTMPPLEHYLARLDAAIDDPEDYASEYNRIQAELTTGDPDGFGCQLSWSNDDGDDAEPGIFSAFIACDDLEDIRRRYVDAVIAQHPLQGERRSALIALLQRRRHYSDNRRVTRAHVFAAVRAVLETGGRVMIDPKGRIEGRPAWPRPSWRGDDRSNEEVAAALQASKRYFQIEQRWRSHATIRRIVTAIGRPFNGWSVAGYLAPEQSLSVGRMPKRSV